MDIGHYLHPYANNYYFRESSEISRAGAIKYGIAIFMLTVTYGVSFIHYFYYSEYYAMKIRVALTGVIYRKVCFNHISARSFDIL